MGEGVMADLRFCAYQYQHLPLDSLRQRWLEAEQHGFDVVWNCDTVVEPDRPRHVMFDGPTTLTMMAAETSRIRVGTLVSSLYFRQPVTVAKAAMTLDHLTDGRVEIGLGVGDPSAGAAAAGVTWSPAEQVARFAEFVELLDLLLRQEVTTYAGAYYRCDAAETIPLPVQRPRPPITVAAHGPKMLRIAARYADGWSSWGGYGVETEQDFYAVTAQRAERFDDLATDFGREAGSIRHSVVCFPPLTPWESTEYFTDMVGRFSGVGIDEFVLYWPGTWRDEPRGKAVLREVTTRVIPQLRKAAGT
ncbi:LLM class flavin-dependent oxidoreductase [Mycobacterium sp.]|uniref:LLM class flavin-dependent oxidoreductase n=1 Tax=Mycobacterium sp. TaxID=1785 RepID=UPI0028BE54A3|nr:LLM class flavin-dependent oxidoreductase [Mycobacterium sp.]